MFHVRTLLAGLVLGGFVLAGSLLGSGTAAHAGGILTISGKIDPGNLDLSVQDLEKMPTTIIRTKTPWHDGVVTFEGIRLKQLMNSVKATGNEAQVVALNDYRTAIPLSDFTEDGPILAYKRDGEYMPVSDKGPFFVVYPYDEHPEYNSETYYARSAWQVRSIKID